MGNFDQPTGVEFTMRLRHSVLTEPGIARQRRGKGFAYYGPDGDRLCDEHTLQRIKDLVIPPAWKKVWICPYANGHIQPSGRTWLGDASIYITKFGNGNVPKRSLTGFWNCPNSCRNGVRRSPATWRAGV
jgi:hypothetical protein